MGGKSDVRHVSVHTRGQLDAVGFEGNWTFGLWLIEPGGQSVQTGGIIEDRYFEEMASQGSPQWCVWPCEHGLEVGTVDETMVYGYAQHQQKEQGLDREDDEGIKGHGKVLANGVWWGSTDEGVDVVIAVSVCVLGCAIVGNVL